MLRRRVRAVLAALAVPLLVSPLHAAPPAAPSNGAEVLVADFNHDGIPDVLIPSSTSPTGTIAFGTIPYGTFSPVTKAVTTPSACVVPSQGSVPSQGAVAFGSVVAADFNGDGFPDLYFTCGTSTSGQTTISGVMLGIGDGTFAPPVLLNAPFANSGVAGDFNRDGKMDLVLVSYPNGYSGSDIQNPALLFFAGNGDGTFAAPVTSALGTSATFQPGQFVLSSPVATDVDGDGYPDIVLNSAYGYSPTNFNGATLSISVFGNKQNGSFGVLTSGTRLPDVTAAAGTYPAANDLKVLAGNFFGDAHPSFAVPDSGTSAGIFLIRNTSTPGAFSLATATKAAYAGIQSATTATFTGGYTDLLVSNGNAVTALINDGAGNFGGTGSTPVVYGGLSLSTTNPLFAAADANGDGYSDVYTATSSSDGLRLAVNLVSGSATANTAPLSLPIGDTPITANWSGNINYSASSANGTQTVTLTPTTISLSSSANPSNSGGSVTFTGTVSPSITTESVPTGIYKILDGSTQIATGTIEENTGSFTFTTNSLTVGTHPIQAVYAGDSFFANSTSSTLSQVVNRATAATPVLVWAPRAITVGTPLSSTQLNAVATDVNGVAIPGTYVYSPAAGTVPPLGSQVLSVTFTPTDQTAYTSITGSTTISVLPRNQTAITSNLLLNPGAELGLQNGVIPNWTATGPAIPTVDTGTFDPGINPHIGAYDFVGNNGASGSLSQTVSLLAQGVTPAMLDSGTVLANLTFWEQGLSQSNPSDDASVTLTFLDASGAPIGSNTTGEADSHNGVWLGTSIGYSIPAGTRSITYTMNFIRHAGSDLDAFIDDNELILVNLSVPPPPAATLAITSGTTAVTTVPSGTPVTLTATVLSGTSPISTGQVNFCDASALTCSDIHLIGTAQLTPTGTATFKFVPGLGVHSYKAVFLGTSSIAAAASPALSLAVTGLYPTVTSLAQSGNTGNYALTATVTATGAPGAPAGLVSFTNSTNANTVLATAPLGSAVKTLSFTTSASPSTGQGPIGVTPYDLNADGKKDLVVNNASGNTLSILLGNGDGTFTPAPTLTTGQYPSSVAIGDFNNDGIPDIAVTNFLDSTLSVFLGQGNGIFTAAPTINTGTDSRTVTTADFNRDGLLDLAIGHDNSVTILLGNGDGSFSAVDSYAATGNGPNYGIATGDFNGDGIPDIAATNTSDNTISILLGNGDGTFTAAAAPATGSGPVSIAVGDLNADGKLDLAIVDQGDNNVTVLLGNGDGTFTLIAQPTVGANPQGVSIGDLNNDGIPDLAVANENSNTVSILLGKGDGTFTLSVSPTTGANPDRASLADFDGDGIPDIATSNVGAGGISVLLSRVLNAATANVTGINPVGTGPQSIVANYPGNANFAASVSSPVTLTGVALIPVITWNPAVSTITYGTVLGAQQLNATAATLTGTALPGIFTYTPAAGTILTAGTQTIRAVFTPASPLYALATATRTITVAPATPTLVWPTPAPISQGTALSATQLNATAAGVAGTALAGTFTYTPAAGAVPPAGTQTLSVLFTPSDTLNYTTATATVRLTVTGISLAAITPNAVKLGDPATTITLSGAGFTTGSIAQVNGTRIATTYVNATTLTAIVPATNFAALGTLAVSVANPATSTVTSSLPLNVTAPTPAITLTGPTTTQPGSQPALALTISNPYPIPLTATFTLVFASSVTPAVDDPSIQFAAGGRTFTFTVPANSTTVPAIQLQAGTVAGTITIPLTLTAAGVNVTPATLQPVTIIVPGSVPAVTTASITRSSTSFTVTIHGFSNTREVTTASFHFVPATGAQIDTPDVTVPVSTIFSGWFTSTPSVPYGSTFTYTQVFNVSDTAANIGSVQVTLTNAVGVSTIYTAQ